MSWRCVQRRQTTSVLHRCGDVQCVDAVGQVPLRGYGEVQ